MVLSVVFGLYADIGHDITPGFTAFGIIN